MRHRLALLPTLGLAILAVWCIHHLVEASADPMRDYHGHRDPEHYVFPADAVLRWSIAIGVEAMGAIAVLVFARSLALTCFLLAVLCAVVFLGMGVLAMHAPAYYTGHLFWLFCAGAWLLLCAIIVAVIPRATAPSNPGGSA